MSNFEPFRTPGDVLSVVDGVTLASGTTITPTKAIHRVSGTGAIDTITLPYAGFSGPIYLVPTGIFTWTTNDNIGIAGTAVVSKVLIMVYVPSQAKWYPSYLS